ncbi:autolysis histidine kinase LytS [Desulfocucumis palustris]|uniref:histidine kinase n=1 Tax=Desulfocucumis palustris TaxID=1898651 RepID=A0A2L2X6U2_9FIRM|nr:histidine kinase [Desulfocucumis palustris]GBF31887.1 autolysis histidine kinase LytS [Desulfocucumis palustris]
MNRDLFLGVAVRWLPVNAAALGAVVWLKLPGNVAGLVMLGASFVSALLLIFYLKESCRMGQLEEHPLEPTLRIANETLPYLRQGLNMETANKTAEIIRKLTDVAAVAITDNERVLAYIGAGSDHHKAGGPIMTDATKSVLATGELKIIQSRYGLSCPQKNCPLESAVIAPLKLKGEVAGTVKLYQTKQEDVSPSVVKLVEGVAQLLSLQMELAQLDRQAQLVTKAELDALQSQINPHFLFNTLNTIIMFSRTKPETARRLLIRLAAFFRHALKRHGYFNSLREEIEYLNTYIILEKARFRDKIKIIRELDEDLYDYQVPVLTIQPLVENAIKHGIQPKEGQGTVWIRAFLEEEEEIFFEIRDNGVGIPPEKVPLVLKPGFGSGNGVGMSNVHERLKGLFGDEYGLKIESTPGQGTSIQFRIPLVCKSSDKEVN